MRLVFLGTPELAVPSLEALLDAGHHICRVISQPNRARDRGHAIVPTPVCAAATRHNLPITQPTQLKDPALVDTLRAEEADAFIVVAYGRLLPSVLLDIAPDRWINLHPSLLPLYRGPAPIQGPLLNGDVKTGVTTLLVRPEMDAGEILMQWDTPIAPDETAGQLHDRLALWGGECMAETVARFEAETLTPRPQDHACATYTQKLTTADGHLNLREPAQVVRNRVRAMTPWPGATAMLDGVPLKLWRVDAHEEATSKPPGTILRADDAGILVATGTGVLTIRELQRPGKTRMDAGAFLRGAPIRTGAQFAVPDPA